MKISKSDIVKIKESLKAGTFSSKWWRKLSLEINSCRLSNYEKVVVYCKIIEGLTKEIIDVGFPDMSCMNYAIDTLIDCRKNIDLKCWGDNNE